MLQLTAYKKWDPLFDLQYEFDNSPMIGSIV